MVELFRISKGREFQMMGAATEKMRDPKHLRTLMNTYPSYLVGRVRRKTHKAVDLEAVLFLR